MDLGIAPATARPDAFLFSGFLRWRPVFVDAHLRAVDEAQFPPGTFARLPEKLFPEPLFAPFAEPAVDRLPRPEAFRQIAPRVATPEDMGDALERRPEIRGRAAALSRRGSNAYTINFFSLRQAISDIPLGNLGFIIQVSMRSKKYKH